jgi:hypothetical protein
LDEVRRWLDKVPKSNDAEFAGVVHIQIAYLCARTHMSEGRKENAKAVLDSLDSRLSSAAAPWMLQAWAFYKADLAWLSGSRVEALKLAAKELQIRSYRLLSNSFAGPFARWITLTSHEDLDRARAKSILEEMVSNVGSYDAVDQAEVLAAMRVIKLRDGVVDVALNDFLAEKLMKLPGATQIHIDALIGKAVVA